MGSYVVFYLAGMYPLPATQQVLLSSPYFETISFSNPLTNTTTTIQSNNFGGDNIYVRVSLNLLIFSLRIPKLTVLDDRVLRLMESLGNRIVTWIGMCS